MKTNQLFLTIFLVTMVHMASFGQVRPKLQYSVGAGASIDGNNLLYGVNFTNELNYKLGRRTSINLGLTFYQSLGNLEENEIFAGQKSKEQSSGIFISPSLKYDLIQRPSGFKLAFAMGPTLQLGGETFQFPFGSLNPTSDSNFNYVTNKYQRIGIFTELEAEWKSKNPNVVNAVSISATGFDYYYPWYINATYKVRFGLGNK